MVPGLVGIGALISTAIFGATDLRTGKMPNVCTLGSLGAALFAHFLIDGRAGLTGAGLGVLACAALPLGLFLFTKGRAIGGGDVKALAALGAWLGPVRGLEAELVSFVLLSVFALAREVARGRAGALLRRSFSLLLPAPWRPPSGGTDEPDLVEMRFGPALFLGTWVVCAASIWGGS